MIQGAVSQGAKPDRPGNLYLKLLLLTGSAVLVHGYHLGTDDAEIYLPAVKKFVDPSMYPFGDQFFMTHGRLSLFSDLVGISSRLFHVPVDVAVFAWHVLGIFLLLLASWQLIGLGFDSDRARWTAVSVLAAVLAVPVANTALVIMDPYLTARSLSTPGSIFAIAYLLSRQYKIAFAWWVFTALVHPQMSVYVLAFAGILSLARMRKVFALEPVPVFALAPGILRPGVLPQGFGLEPAHDPYREALLMRSYFFLYNWAWYEWCGVVLPLAILWTFSCLRLRGTLPAFGQVCRALVVFAGMSVAVALVVGIPERMQMFARLQPMRSLHLVYVIFFLFLGGLIGEYLFGRNAWLRAGLLFVPLAVGMWFVGRIPYPDSPHIEWPGMRWRNPYMSAFVWIRDNTPKDAVFALDPKYMNIRGVDQHGFRAIAGRSVLADYYKDSGAVSLFPQLAEDWKREVTAQDGWRNFEAADFKRLATEYPVSWILVDGAGPAGFECPYRDQGVAVCRIPRS